MPDLGQVPEHDPGIVAVGFVAVITVAELAAIWNRRLADSTAVALVAWRDGQPIGSVLARQDPDFPEGQIAGLYVLPAVDPRS